MGGCASNDADSTKNISNFPPSLISPQFETIDTETGPGSIAIFGSFDSGKSTLVRKLWLLYGESYTTQERIQYRKHIDATIIHGIFTVLQAFLDMYPPVPYQSLNIDNDVSYATPKKGSRRLNSAESPQIQPKQVNNGLSEDQSLRLNADLSVSWMGELPPETPPQNGGGNQHHQQQEISRNSETRGQSSSGTGPIFNNNNNNVSSIDIDILRSNPTLITTYPHLTKELMEALLYFITLDLPNISLFPITKENDQPQQQTRGRPLLLQQSSINQTPSSTLLSGLQTYGQISSVIPPYLLFNRVNITSTIARYILTIWKNPIIKLIYQNNHSLFTSHPYHNQMFRINNNNNTLVMFCEGYLNKLASNPEYDQLLTNLTSSSANSGSFDELNELITNEDLLLMKFPHILSSLDNIQDSHSADFTISGFDGGQDTKTSDTLQPYVQYQFDSTGFFGLLEQQEERIKKNEEEYFQTIRSASFETPFSQQRQLDLKTSTQHIERTNTNSIEDKQQRQQQQQNNNNVSAIQEDDDDENNNDNNNNNNINNNDKKSSQNNNNNNNVESNMSEPDSISLLANMRSFSTLGPEFYLPDKLYTLDGINQSPPAPLSSILPLNNSFDRNSGNINANTNNNNNNLLIPNMHLTPQRSTKNNNNNSNHVQMTPFMDLASSSAQE